MIFFRDGSEIHISLHIIGLTDNNHYIKSEITSRFFLQRIYGNHRKNNPHGGNELETKTHACQSSTPKSVISLREIWAFSLLEVD